MAFSCLTNETENFNCVAIASVDLIKISLADILFSQIKPIDLFNAIDTSATLLTGKNKLRSEQLKVCYLQPPALPDYGRFDVTLLYTLIRNLCSSFKPTKGWGIDPERGDIRIGDDIERLRLFRNNYYAHASTAAISNTEFKDIWKDLKLVLKRIQQQIGVNYEQKVIQIESRNLTRDHLEECKLILELKRDKRDDPEIFIKGDDEVTCGNIARLEAVVKNVNSNQGSMTWQKRRGNIIKIIDKSREKYSGSTNKKLVIQNVCKEDEGEYYAILKRNMNGYDYTRSENTIQLNVLEEIPHLNDVKVTTENEKITISYSCDFLKEFPSKHVVEWSKNDHTLDQNNIVGGSSNESCLTIMSPTTKDKGKYTCTITSAVGSVSKETILDVPRVEIVSELTICFGSKATIVSVVTSTPSPEIAVWQMSKDGIHFQSMDINDVNYIESNEHPECPVLVISKATFNDKLYYRLLMWNIIGKGVSNTVYLNVTGSPPSITTRHETDIHHKRLRLIGHVSVFNDSPDIQEVFWTKNGEKIDSQGSGGRLSKVTINDPSLTINEVCNLDAGHYKLTAVNAVGSNCDEIILGSPIVSFEYIEENDGSQWVYATIQSIPAPCFIQWSLKSKDDERFAPIDINADDYTGTINTFPHPVLIVRNKNQFKNNSYQIEVTNFVGSTIKNIFGDCKEIGKMTEVKEALETSRVDHIPQERKPTFSNIFGENIEVELDSAWNPVKAKWKFSNSCGLAFSGFSLRANKIYEVIFSGSGHARMGFTQTDPNYLLDIQQAVTKNQIMLVSDIRLHNRQCVLNIVKMVDANGSKFEVMYKQDNPKIKEILPSIDVWAVIYLKFGYIRAQLKDKENGTILKFHEKTGRNIKQEERKISLSLPVPFAYACLENSIEKGYGIRIRVKQIEPTVNKPSPFYLKVGISNIKPRSKLTLDFTPAFYTRIENTECLGEFCVCISKQGYFHIYKYDSSIFTQALTPDLNPKLPMYVCFEVFRVTIKLIDIFHCVHSDAFDNTLLLEDSPYEIVEMINSIQIVDEDIRTMTMSAEVQKKFSDDLTEYANHISVNRRNRAFLSTISTDPNEGEEKQTFTMNDILIRLEEIEKRILEKHLDGQQNGQKILEAIKLNRDKIIAEIRMNCEVFTNHLQNTCTDFIANLDAFPLCDYLLQIGILSQHQYKSIFDEHRENRREANRALFRILVKTEYTLEQLRKLWTAFIESNQESLLPDFGSL